jgi:hypothetical protein
LVLFHISFYLILLFTVWLFENKTENQALKISKSLDTADFKKQGREVARNTSQETKRC